jgi:hypothetical protein
MSGGCGVRLRDELTPVPRRIAPGPPRVILHSICTHFSLPPACAGPIRAMAIVADGPRAIPAGVVVVSTAS